MIKSFSRTVHAAIRKLWIGQLLAQRMPGGNCCLNEPEFSQFVRSEMVRCQRRGDRSPFGLVMLAGDFDLDQNRWGRLIRELRSEVRLTDQIGYYQGKVAVLLPETDRKGCLVVMNRVLKRGDDLGVAIDAEVFVFPWDDPISCPTTNLTRDTQLTLGRNDLESERESAMQLTSQKELAKPRQERATAGLAMEVCRPFELGHGVLTHPNRQAFDVDRSPFPHRSRGTVDQAHYRVPAWKRAMDVVGAGAGLLVLAPLMAAAAAAIKLETRGPVFFVQLREGKDGRIFKMFKLRTMKANAELQQAGLRSVNEQDGPAFKIKDDPRITRVGRVLRKSCIDELPQLLNVVRGEMSLVGPRPLPISESRACQDWQRRRLEVLPGMTCIWQSCGNSQIAFEDWMRMDITYVDRTSLHQDLTLLWKTFWLVLRLRGSV